MENQLTYQDKLNLSTLEFVTKAKKLLAEKKDESLFKVEKMETRELLTQLLTESREDVANAIKIVVIDKINKILSVNN